MAYAAGYAAFQELLAGDLNTDFANVAAMIARKSVDETVNNSAAFQNDNELLLPLEANRVYLSKTHVVYNSGATPDLKYQFTLPAGATTPAWSGFWYNTALSLIYADGAEANTVGGNGTNLPFDLTGIVVCGATPGTMQFQWAQATANASNSIVRAGSYFMLIPIN